MVVKKKMSISRVFLYNLLAVTLLSVFAVGFFWISREYSKFNEDSEQLRTTYISEQKSLIKSEVDRVIDYITYNKSVIKKHLKRIVQGKVDHAFEIAMKMSEINIKSLDSDERKTLIVESLRSMAERKENGVMFIVDDNEKIILSGFAKEQEGKKLSQIDIAGNSLITDLYYRAKKYGEGEIAYEYTTNGEQQSVTGYIRKLDRLGWYIGVGTHQSVLKKDLQYEILHWIENIRLKDGGYVFVNTYDGKALVFDGKYQETPPDNWDLTDPDGIKIVQKQRELVERPEGGFFRYTFKKMEGGIPKPKISFIRGVSDWQWMIGAGVYLDGVDLTIADKRAELMDNVITQIEKILLIILTLIITIGFIVRYMSHKARISFDIFSDFFKKASTESLQIRQSEMHFSEFANLAGMANDMIAERLSIESEKEVLQEQLVRSKKMESLGMLAGGVAHDLNNILSGLVTYPELLLMELPEGSPMRKKVETILKSGRQASAIVQDVLTLARGVATQKEPLQVNAVVNDYLSSPDFQKTSELHPLVEVKSDLDNELFNINGAEVHIRKALMNLTINGMESVQGAGQVLIKTENVFLDRPLNVYESIPQGEYIKISVRDTGNGISPNALKFIFEPFYTKKQMGKSGTGLGLVVVWNTVKDHGGFINVNSSDKGTTFEMFFPITRNEVQSDKKALPVDSYKGNGESILVIDDDPTQREIACSILVQLGYRAEAAKGGEDALRILRRKNFDLLLLDMIMQPGWNGRETYERILEIYPKQKAIIASGYSETHEVKETQKLGAGAFLRKPYKIERIGLAIHNELNSHKN